MHLVCPIVFLYLASLTRAIASDVLLNGYMKGAAKSISQRLENQRSSFPA